MKTRKYNKARAISELGSRTFTDCLETLERFVDTDKLTAKQVADILDAMYASGIWGYNQAFNEFGPKTSQSED